MRKILTCFLNIGPFPFLFLISSRALNIRKGTLLPLFHPPGLWIAPRNPPMDLILGAHLRRRSGPIFDFSGDRPQMLQCVARNLGSGSGGLSLGLGAGGNDDSKGGNNNTDPYNNDPDSDISPSSDSDNDDDDHDDADKQSEMWYGPLHDEPQVGEA